MQHIFLDESGDLGFGLSKYFVIAALYTKNPKPVYNCIKRIKKSTTKKYRKTQELHFSESAYTLRRRVLECLVKKNIQISYLMLNRDDIIQNPSLSPLISKLGILKDALFLLLISETLKEFEIRGNPHIIIDRYLSTDSINSFNKGFSDMLTRESEKVSIKKDIETVHMHSYQNKGLQAVDFIAGAIHMRFRDDNPQLYRLISSKIGHGIIIK